MWFIHLCIRVGRYYLRLMLPRIGPLYGWRLKFEWGIWRFHLPMLRGFFWRTKRRPKRLFRVWIENVKPSGGCWFR